MKGQTQRRTAMILFGLAAIAALAIQAEARAVKPFEDVRGLDLKAKGWTVDPAIIKTLWFNEKTVWPDNAAAAARNVLRKGQNPGLGLRALHSKGITGKGVTVAIIDQNMFLDHPEFAGKIVQYKDFGCGTAAVQGSMHAPAVTSLLLGTKIGAAPGARMYFAAVPSWLCDARYYARALDWIVAENAKLPAGSKIRAISISAAPAGVGSPYTVGGQAYLTSRTKAEKAGILVMDCTDTRCVTLGAYYDLNAPDDLSKCKLGFPSHPGAMGTAGIYIPSTRRTQAEEYDKGDCSYQYTGSGGLSWTVPFLTGVLALGWQVNPKLSGLEMLNLVRSSAYLKSGKYMIVNPKAFIAALSSTSSPGRR
jgi:serine protease AprX